MCCGSGRVGVDVVFVLFFKQKTAYEMRISDWRSDVCSSDLVADDLGLEVEEVHEPRDRAFARAVGVVHSRRDFALEIESQAVFSAASDRVQVRSEERRVGTECVSSRRSRGSPYT